MTLTDGVNTTKAPRGALSNVYPAKPVWPVLFFAIARLITLVRLIVLFMLTLLIEFSNFAGDLTFVVSAFVHFFRSTIVHFLFSGNPLFVLRFRKQGFYLIVIILTYPLKFLAAVFMRGGRIFSDLVHLFTKLLSCLLHTLNLF